MARSKKYTTGRPSIYKPKLARQAAHLTLLGLSVKDICVNLEINVDTYYAWLKTNPQFSEAVAKAKASDGRIANALRKRAEGFTKRTEKLFHFQGSVIRAEVREYFPPDVGAASKWLKVKHPDKWGDHIGAANNQGGGGNVQIFVDAHSMALAGADVDTDRDFEDEAGESEDHSEGDAA